MAQQPAVIIIARHGARLDAADQNWHLSTPTPYDPPLTYGGWNQCRALGVRIASLLHAREQSINDATHEPPPPEGTTSRDFAGVNGGYAGGDGSRKRKRRKHKVVIHSSPFLRCLQTSVAVSAGMAQFQPGTGSGSGSSKSRTPSSMHSASPRIRAMEGLGGSLSPSLMPIAEPKHDFMHEIARRTLGEQHKRHRKSQMRVDAFLGEWLNPQYFDQITPPPPSAMMIKTAKGELVQNDPLDVFTPTLSTKSSHGSLWGASRNVSRESTLDDWSHVQDTLPAPTPRRDRASSVNSANSDTSGSGHRSPFRPGHVLQPNTSTLAKQEASAYVAPTPQYAVSNADHIPRGYLAHARNATVNVDYQWDSSRQPQDWGDGGEYGEEWSSMHKRFRRGLNHLVQWYSQHEVDDRGEDALGLEQADHHGDDEEEEESDEQEDLVVVLVTHGAGSNALIGALTGQPVLLDVGMSSLTMAVRRDDAPPLASPHSSVASSDPSTTANTPRHSPQPPAFINANASDHARRTSLDLGLSAIYEMKLVASLEHLRPGSDPSRASSTTYTAGSTRVVSKDIASRPSNSRGDSSHSAAGAPTIAAWSLGEEIRPKSQSSSLGSIRRPNTAFPSSLPSSFTSGGVHRSSTLPTSGTDHDSMLALPQPSLSGTSTPGSGGLWTPPTARTPVMSAKDVQEERRSIFSSLNEDGGLHGSGSGGRTSPGHDLVLDFSNSPPESRPTSSGGSQPHPPLALDGTFDSNAADDAEGADLEPLTSADSERDVVPDLPDLPRVGDKVPSALSRGLSQKGLWGNKPKGDEVRRVFGEPKRRWTLLQEAEERRPVK